MSNWNRVKVEINALVKRLRAAILSCNALELLSFCYRAAVKRFAADEIGPEMPALIGDVRAAEYVQTVFVTAGQGHSLDQGIKDENLFSEILEMIAELYRKSITIMAMHSIEVGGNFHAAMSCSIRGRRHVVFQHGYHAMLLQAHDQILQQTYGIGYEQIVDGLDRLIAYLYLGKMDTGDQGICW